MRAYLDALASGGASMTLPDYRDTHDLLSNVDAVVSPMSTILLEAALHGKPIAAYLPGKGDGHLDMMVPLLHFDELFALEDIVVADGMEALVEAIPILVSPEGEERGTRLRDAATEFVAPFTRPWRERIVDLLSATAGDQRQRLAAE
jgi:CDP-glycerol glycerophosphotransferase (TagB/SpsB family)